MLSNSTLKQRRKFALLKVAHLAILNNTCWHVNLKPWHQPCLPWYDLAVFGGEWLFWKKAAKRRSEDHKASYIYQYRTAVKLFTITHYGSKRHVCHLSNDEDLCVGIVYIHTFSLNGNNCSGVSGSRTGMNLSYVLHTFLSISIYLNVFLVWSGHFLI